MTEREAADASGIGLITTDTPFGRHMAHRLSQDPAGGEHRLTRLLVVHRPDAGRKARQIPGLYRLRRMISRRTNLDHRVWLQQRAAMEQFERMAGPAPEWPRGCAQRSCLSGEVNGAENVEWMRAANLKVLVLAGAPILKAPMIGTPALGTLNIHSSLLPHYRGTRAEFWQVHNAETERAGLTVHYVDTGVDSGDILLQMPLDAEPGEGPWRMRARNQVNALDAMQEAVGRVIAGTAERVRQQPTSERAYRFSDITPDAIRRVLARTRC